MYFLLKIFRFLDGRFRLLEMDVVISKPHFDIACQISLTIPNKKKLKIKNPPNLKLNTFQVEGNGNFYMKCKLALLLFLQNDCQGSHTYAYTRQIKISLARFIEAFEHLIWNLFFSWLLV